MKLDSAAVEHLRERQSALTQLAHELRLRADGPRGTTHWAVLCHEAAEQLEEAHLAIDLVVREGSAEE